MQKLSTEKTAEPRNPNSPRTVGINADLMQLVLGEFDGGQRQRQKMRQAFMQTVRAINSVAARHDHYTAHHQERVAILTLELGRKLGMSADCLDGLYLGALVHDLGKVTIPSELLNKPGRLTPEEFALVKTHVPSGCEIIQGITLPWPIREIIAQHHERLDGSGYPNGLVGGAIIPEARIVAVADVFQALCEERPYRKALGIRAALDELNGSAGEKFDADVVRELSLIAGRQESSAGDLWERITTDMTGAMRRRRADRTGRSSVATA